MITTSQKQFILDTLLPYFQNPDSCGIDNEIKKCVYLTSDGRKCAVGKHMKEGPWQQFKFGYHELIKNYKKEDFFTQEALEQNLSDDIWVGIQGVHDSINFRRPFTISYAICSLEELAGVEFPELREITK